MRAPSMVRTARNTGGPDTDRPDPGLFTPLAWRVGQPSPPPPDFIKLTSRGVPQETRPASFLWSTPLIRPARPAYRWLSLPCTVQSPPPQTPWSSLYIRASLPTSSHLTTAREYFYTLSNLIIIATPMRSLRGSIHWTPNRGVDTTQESIEHDRTHKASNKSASGLIFS